MTPERIKELRENYKLHDLAIHECLDTIELLTEHTDQLDAACYALDEKISELKLAYEKLGEENQILKNLIYPEHK